MNQSSVIRPSMSVRGFTLAEIMIVTAIIGILIAVAVPTWIRQRGRAQQRACQENMVKIDSAKHQWAMENRKHGDDSVALVLLYSSNGKSYLNYRPGCPSEGTYTLGTVGELTSCSTIDPFDHNEGR